MIKRIYKKKIINFLEKFPIVAILGARQVGKTTLAKFIKDKYFKDAIYLDLEYPPDTSKLENPEIFLSQFEDRLVIIDEIQRKPELFELLRALVDKKRNPARFLILGSASPDILKRTSETLAGRIAYIELKPFSLVEIGKENWKNLWIKGGFPESYIGSLNDSFVWREFFIKTFLERDIPQIGFRIEAENIRKFWLMIAHLQNQLWNSSQIANNLGVTAPTVKHYLDILHYTYMVRILQPFFINIKKRLIKTPKIILKDSGILHCLLNIRSFDELIVNPNVGASWEGFVIEEILKIKPDYLQPYFYRTRAGAEIDLILTEANRVKIAIEIKFSLTPKVEKGFYNAINDLKPKFKWIVYPGDESYPIKNNIWIVSIKDIPKFLENQ